MKSRLTLIQTVVVCFVVCSVALGQDLASFEKRTTVKKLANGLTIIICERPEANGSHRHPRLCRRKSCACES